MKPSIERIFFPVAVGAIALAWVLFMWRQSFEPPKVAELGIREQEIQMLITEMIKKREVDFCSMKEIRQKAIKELEKLEELL